ncbi:GCN5-related N-acetyl-transferase-domain-containing protein [Dichotomocladium elegans]|nr:GCN5-related N-acetyl-transferase-domain-containing protein [Dichotomocladium elegans]
MTRPASPPSSSQPNLITNSSNSDDCGGNKNDQPVKLNSGVPRHSEKAEKGGLFASPRLCSAALFAVPSVSLSNAHAVSSSIGPLTPPLTLDQQQASDNATMTATIKTSSQSLLPILRPESCTKLQTTATVQQKQQHQSIQKRKHSFCSADVVHDVYCCMFRITLDDKGSIAALCYLPTRFQKMIEFYHTEIPTAYRDLGLGDLLVAQGFRWAEATNLLVIPTCPFVQRYLDRNSKNWGCVVHTESEGLSRLFAAASLSSLPSSTSPVHRSSPPSPAPVSLQHEEPKAVE